MPFGEHLINTMSISVDQNYRIKELYWCKATQSEIWYGLSESIQEHISLGL